MVNDTFGGEVIRQLNLPYETAPLEAFADWQRLQAADKVGALGILFGKEASSSAEYQALTPAETASLLTKMIENSTRQKDVAVSTSFLEGIINLLNGIA